MDVAGSAEPGPFAETVEEVLQSDGFDTRMEPIGDRFDVLMAENDYAVAAVVSAKSWKDIAQDLPELQTGIANWAAQKGAGAKQWDLYLVLLLADVLGDAELAAATDAATDLRLVRKIVRAGVGPQRRDIRRALAPLLPLSAPQRGEVLAPLSELERRLPAHGVTSEQAESALAAFLASGGEGPDDGPQMARD